jgi:hypothetical protein
MKDIFNEEQNEMVFFESTFRIKYFEKEEEK